MYMYAYVYVCVYIYIYIYNGYLAKWVPSPPGKHTFKQLHNLSTS